ncbi:MAG: tyrosine-protein phosphatase [Chloroflexi bacterium]|jgi:protein-tyrosine phosphatase|uniref:Protein-tyrosine-phosphatase n=1 Tax=Candidatus Thermofonsia Clade 3 bacterium TaxID=2364212 RepID=A0A2M8QGM9_9CHLR|nr:tyrosine-protein phosphatase [Candidatus Roseilinea sp. NK_OTU-006]PJF48928.1 MAG: protein-tyrosine-phosphatase [Candidatus Thermofonsia Clade 3 bacterium]RMG65109.1 MAG: tyrosine-protein phosphatase [Chloroflexota bacterium]
MTDILMRRLHWEGCLNARDLGGLSTGDGRFTRWGALVRMDNPGHLTDAGVRALLDYGVNTVIDLRYPTETTRYPHLAAALHSARDRVTLRHIPLLDEASRAEEDILFARSRDEWHIYVLDRRGETIAEVMRAIAYAAPGAVVLHCTAGKDRTGLIAALLLDLLCVAREDIARDYAVSEEWLRPRIEQWLEPLDEAQRAFAHSLMRTAPEYVQFALRYVDERYGGTCAYLQSSGLSPDDLNALRERLTELPAERLRKPERSKR